jgi:hypothetical protein
VRACGQRRDGERECESGTQHGGISSGDARAGSSYALLAEIPRAAAVVKPLEARAVWKPRQDLVIIVRDRMAALPHYRKPAICPDGGPPKKLRPVFSVLRRNRETKREPRSPKPFGNLKQLQGSLGDRGVVPFCMNMETLIYREQRDL